jgi:hypothetical protein
MQENSSRNWNLLAWACARGLRRVAFTMIVGAVALTPAGNAQAPTQNPSGETQSPSTGPSMSAPANNASATTPATKSSNKVVPYRYRAHPVPKRAREYYSLVWGVEDFSVKAVESGEIIRFSYRILDADKAKMLNDKKNEPSLIDPEAGVRLVVPTLEKVGQLRQSTSPEAGKVYWMAFSNKGRHVKPGHRVNIVIGNFRADGLIVR